MLDCKALAAPWHDCRVRLQDPPAPPAAARRQNTAMTVAEKRSGLRLTTPDSRIAIDVEPLQGLWTEAQYLRLTDHARLLIEFADGRLEVPPMPTDRHQAISQVLFLALSPFVEARGGKVRYAPLRLRIREGRFREPDLLLVRNAGDPRRRDDYWRGADLVVEVVSPDDPERDTLVKRRDYAEARIPEYWIVNPVDETITVLTLAGGEYAEHGVFRRGRQARSVCLDGFAVGVADVFDAQ